MATPWERFLQAARLGQPEPVPVALIVRLPRWMPLAHPALEVDTPILTVDLFPTLLQAARLEPPQERRHTMSASLVVCLAHSIRRLTPRARSAG
jgi:hypothetical protein